MQFALNWSPQAQALLAEGAITIDRYKCPDWDDLIAQAQAQHPVYIHFAHVVGSGRAVDLARAAALAERTGTSYINTHCAPDQAAGALDAVLRDLDPLCSYFGAERVILENVPHPDYILNLPPESVDPALIRRAIETSGCGLLLDLAHATLASAALGCHVREYIEQLPVERLRELHVTGLGTDQQGRRTDHLPMTEDDWALLEWALAQIRSGAWRTPDIVACEYGGIGPLFDWRSDANVIAEQIPRMVQQVRG